MTSEMTRMLRALADPTRVQILEFLSSMCCGRASVAEDGGIEGPTAGQICCHITGAERVTSTISHHLTELREAGLIQVERRGKYIVCTLCPDALRDVSSFLLSLAGSEPVSCCSPIQGEPMSESKLTDRDDVRDLVREKYGEVALRVLSSAPASCCGPSAPEGDEGGCCQGSTVDPITSNLYDDLQASEIPEAALLASLGCGNPTALAQLSPGETVLDLGSGGGIDVLLSARRVGPEGFAYGLDMTDEMLELAERNRADSGLENVRFLKGHIEQIPLPDASVDVIISNCVINLSADKSAVLREAFRVLRPGGRFAVSDVVVEGSLPPQVRQNMEMYVGCVAGALERSEYLALLAEAGFVEASIEPTRRYQFSQIEGAWAPKGIAAMTDAERQQLDGKIMGAFIRAVKP